MDKAEVRETFERDWAAWTSALAEIDPEATREPGVCGEWTIHDVVGHVHMYLRYYLAQTRAAFDHVEATDAEIMGDRPPMPEGTANTLHERNAALQRAGLEMTWGQLLDESAWLRDRALAFIEARSEDELNEEVGWVEFWNPDVPKPDELKIHVRRVREAPAAAQPVPVWRFIHPDGTDGHMQEHLGQIRAWLGSASAGDR